MNAMSPLRILHTEASLGWGGQEIRLLSESKAMLERGHAVHLLCPPNSRISTEAKRYGVPTTIAPMGRKNISGLFAVRSWLATHPTDVVITHSSTDSWLVALASQTLAKPAPIVRLRHISTPVPDNAPTRWLYTRASRHIVTTGVAIRNRLIQVNRYPAIQITSIPTGIDLDRFTPGDRHLARQRLHLPDDAPIIGIVATLRSWKGHSFLLEAFKNILNDPDGGKPRLVIVGDGPQQENLHRQALEINLQERIHFAGYQRDPLPWLQAMDVFSLPSYGNEGVPQALMQAMACGLPVVSTPVGSIPEIITPEHDGLLVRPKDSLDLATALKRVLHDNTLGKNLGICALQTARQRFDIDHMTSAMEELLSRMAQTNTVAKV
ncbi:MAG: glycosyl transferase family 1 [Magnetococcales bacterium]|nr:glycosyl transferase family 1 [Magnetococcales bacterium]HIJ85416.1 glycosyltransferase [Magnetococcales bacterium]